MGLRITCGGCGYMRTYRTPPMAEAHFDRHSCRSELKRQAERRRVRARRANRGGPARECRHPIAHHEHGTRLAYILDGCRCAPCMDAVAAYERDRTRKIQLGQWNHRVDSGPARQRLLDLQATGTSYAQVSRMTGVPKTTLGTLIYGRHDRRGGIPPRTISADYAQRILTLVPNPLAKSDRSRIDATGSRRRLQALVCAGWSINRLGEQLGVARGNMCRVFIEQAITARRARQIAELYEWGWQGPPVASRFQQAGVTKAKRYAVEHGWLPPMAWPDDAIDDPGYDPAAEDEEVLVDELAVESVLLGYRVPLAKRERVAAVHLLTEHGLSARQIQDRVGIVARQVQRDRKEAVSA